MVVVVIAFHCLVGDAVEPMLADHHGPLLTGFDVLRDQQYAPGKNVREHIQHHFIACEFRGVVDAAYPRIQRQLGIFKAPQDLFSKILPVPLRSFNERVG